MHAFCTYCSSSKRQDPGEIPAIDRYKSPRINRIHSAARQVGVEFFILSGKFGLIPPNQPLPYYDHLLELKEVPALVELVSSQTREYGIHAVVYFTKSPRDSNLLPYLTVILIACSITDVQCHVVDLEERDMSSWRDIMRAAEDAKLALISDRSTGESQFQSLLR